MAYLQEFQREVHNRNFSKILILWEEYCANDRVDPDEFLHIFQVFKKSDFREELGKLMEKALPLLELIEEEEASYQVLKQIVDLQTTNSPQLAEKAYLALENRFKGDPSFDERMRLIGLRAKQHFQGALSYYELLHHLKPGNVVFHEGGWGTGEIMDVSALREHVIIEFENVTGKKDLSFSSAFKSLIPLPPTHFLSRRFLNPDALEEEARKNPVEIIKLLLKDLGPLTASEIKDAMCELVIPEKEWVRWWQGARNRLKKDPFVESPKTLRDQFRLRKSKITAEERVENVMAGKTEINEWIVAMYHIVRDQANTLKNPEIAEELKKKMLTCLGKEPLTPSQRLQILFLLEHFSETGVENTAIQEAIEQLKNMEQTIREVEILAFKKRILQAIQKYRLDWKERFLQLFLSLPQGMLKDFILQELLKTDAVSQLKQTLHHLAQHPKQSPETFFWYFQKVFSSKKEEVLFSDIEERILFFEAFLILYSQIEWDETQRDLLKKMYQILSGSRFLFIRQRLQEMSLEYTKEFLLLVSKCQTISHQDQQILRSLAEVVHPSLKSISSQKENPHENIIWTTEEGYLRTQQEIQKIGTVEIVENAKEIEAARALGDLRENSEYKFALERRSWLQGQLKRLSHQLAQARILTPQDIDVTKVDIGTSIEIKSLNGKTTRYTILGPWDADAEKNILSFQSKFAKAMLGCKKGQSFSFRDDTYEIVHISSVFE